MSTKKKGKLIALPEGTTASRGAHIALSILADLGYRIFLVPGRYVCKPVGWGAVHYADSGAWFWYLESPNMDVLAGGQWPTDKLWRAHKDGAAGTYISQHGDIELILVNRQDADRPSLDSKPWKTPGSGLVQDD